MKTQQQTNLISRVFSHIIKRVIFISGSPMMPRARVENANTTASSMSTGRPSRPTVSKACTVVSPSPASVSSSTVACTSACTIPSSPSSWETTSPCSCPSSWAGVWPSAPASCPTPSTPSGVVWWWLPVPPSSTRAPSTAVCRSSRTKASCPWWRELVPTSSVVLLALVSWLVSTSSRKSTSPSGLEHKDPKDV